MLAKTNEALPLYFVEVDFGSVGTAFVETDRLTNSRQRVLENIRHGEWPGCEVLRVLEVNEDEGTCRDVTEDMARDVLEALDADFEAVPSFLTNFIDRQLGTGAADDHDASLDCGRSDYAEHTTLHRAAQGV